ncbi:hypothetical protein ABMA28_006540 [Loxostege sticticalis]|uniref:DUF7041 domain-containing protein n=1 Tax=Loxostege sticticalis TaxID=481309 RepID=A0ABD0SQI6_LOXSC
MYASNYAEPTVPPPAPAGTPAQEPPAPSPDISTVSVASKIPDFWPENPRLWFVQVEAILTPQKTSDINMYYMVVAKLNKEAIQQVADILSKPPEQNKFETLKNRLLQIYEESETRQIQKLISEVELGDQKPSQLLRKMKELARGKIEDDTLNILWQGHLPSSVRAVLTVTSSQDLDSLASVADKIMETYQPARINEVSRSREPVTAYDVAAIMAEISKINLKMAEMNQDRERYRGRSRSRSRNRNFSRSATRSSRTPDSPNWLCSYHYRFRARARKYVPPCNWRNPTAPPQTPPPASLGN